MLFKNSVIYLIGQILTTLAAIVLLPLFSKNLSQHDFGIISMIWIINPILNRVLTLGVDTSFCLKFYKLDIEEKSSYIYNSILVILFVTFTTYSVFTASFKYWQELVFDSKFSGKLFSVFFISILFGIFYAYFQAILKFENKPFYFVSISFLYSTLLVGLSYYLIIHKNLNYDAYIYSFLISNLVLSIIFIIHVFVIYPFKYFSFNLNHIKSMLKIGLPVVPTSIASLILASGDRFVIKIFLGLEAVAIYTIGYRFAEYLNMFLFQPFMTAYTPVALKNASEDFNIFKELNETIMKKTNTFFGLVVIFSLIFFKDIFLLLTKADYISGYIIFILATIGIMIYNIAQITSMALLHFEKTSSIMKMVFIASILNIVLNVLVVKQFGIVSAAITTIITFQIMFHQYLKSMNKISGTTISSRNFYIRLFPLIIYSIIFYYIDMNLKPEYIIAYSLKIILFTLYPIILYKLNEFKEIIEFLSRKLTKTN